jgi:hypothetical protein
MPRSRTAGLVLCIAAGLSFLSPSPAAASPSLYAYTTVRQCGSFYFTGDNSVNVPCPVVFASSVTTVLVTVRNSLEDLVDAPIAATAELVVDQYIGEPLESVPFFGDGLAQLATTLIVVPFTVTEWLFDTIAFPVLNITLGATEILLGWVAGAVDGLLGFGWLAASYVLDWFLGFRTTITEAIEGATLWLSDAISDLSFDVFGLIVDVDEVVALFVTFGSIQDGFQELADGTAAVVESISVEVGGPFGPVSMPGGVSVDVLAVADTIPSGLEAAVYLLSGLAFIFAVVQACGFVAKVTESG